LSKNERKFKRSNYSKKDLREVRSPFLGVLPITLRHSGEEMTLVPLHALGL